MKQYFLSEMEQAKCYSHDITERLGHKPCLIKYKLSRGGKNISVKTSLHQGLEKLTHLAFLAPVEE